MQIPLNEAAFASCENLSREAFYILYHGLATYAELDSQLTLEDAITLIEFHRVAEHNRKLIKDLENELGNRR